MKQDTESNESSIKKWIQEDRRITIQPSILPLLRLRAKRQSLEEVAKIVGRLTSNVSVSLKSFRRNYQLLCYIVDTVRNENLLEETSAAEMRRKRREIRIKMAEKGIYIGQAPVGFKRRGHTFIWTKRMDDVIKLYNGFLKNDKSVTELADDTHLEGSLSRVYAVLRNTLYKGEFVLLGKTYKGNWKPPINRKTWDEVQRRFAPGPRKHVLFGYSWLDGKRVLKPGAKEAYEKMFDMRAKAASYKKIGKAVGLSARYIIQLIRDRRVTGKIKVEGKLVDSGYEQAVDEERWKSAQEITKMERSEETKKHHVEIGRKIMVYVPAFRWQLREKLKESSSMVCHVVDELKNQHVPMLKERDNGLLQSDWKPFPSGPLVETKIENESLKRLKILKILFKEGALSRKKIAEKTDININTLRLNIRKLLVEGFVEQEREKTRLFEENKIRLSEIGLAALKDRLELPKLSTS